MRYELWELPDPPENEAFGDWFLLEGDSDGRRMAIEDGCVVTWSVEARGWDEAKAALHVYRGWEPYKPMLRDDGTPFPEDEDDKYHEESGS
jgi:hypothetical protein